MKYASQKQLPLYTHETSSQVIDFPQNPPPKKRYGKIWIFWSLEGIFFSKISEKDPDITVAL